MAEAETNGTADGNENFSYRDSCPECGGKMECTRICTRSCTITQTNPEELLRYMLNHDIKSRSMGEGTSTAFDDNALSTPREEELISPMSGIPFSAVPSPAASRK